MNATIYRFMEDCAPYLVLWSFAFTLATSFRIVRRFRLRTPPVADNVLYTELAGLPLALLQLVGFVWAARTGDWRSMLLFGWWGPGFIVVAIAVAVSKARRTPIDWHPWRNVISCLCKGYYLAYVVVFLVMAMPGMLLAFSVWIINDQYEKAFMSGDADRLRRTFDDFWFFRVLYPAGLLTPYFFPAMPYRAALLLYGTALLALWMLGIVHVWRTGMLLARPSDPSLLRNMVYFRKLRK